LDHNGCFVEKGKAPGKKTGRDKTLALSLGVSIGHIAITPSMNDDGHIFPGSEVT
jgi:hypothetical protein